LGSSLVIAGARFGGLFFEGQQAAIVEVRPWTAVFANNLARPILDFSRSRPYIAKMTKLLDEAMEVVRRLPSDDQDDIARAIMQLAGSDLPAPVVLSPEEREAIARSKAAADRGEFATDEQVRAVWAKHGL
jgi:hypothetical protein